MDKTTKEQFTILLVGSADDMYNEAYLGIWGVAIGNRYAAFNDVKVEHIFLEDYVTAENHEDDFVGVNAVINISMRASEEDQKVLDTILKNAMVKAGSVLSPISHESAFKYISRVMKGLDSLIWGDRDDTEGVKH